jgi:oxidase EvaA
MKALTLSANTHSANFHDLTTWITRIRSSEILSVQRYSLSEAKLWSLNIKRGVVEHASGKFFSVRGLAIEKIADGVIEKWEQPIIQQPEVGLLGLLSTNFDGVTHFLVQAKVEPGNVNLAQLGPTLQATQSNYLQIHEGKKPLFLDFFIKSVRKRKLIDQTQSEQGARFLGKKNRNMVVHINELPLITHPMYRWLTLRDLNFFLKDDNLINMNLRSIISHLNLYVNIYQIISSKGRSIIDRQRDYSDYYLIEALNQLRKKRLSVNVKRTLKKVTELENWLYSDDEIRHASGDFFKVIYLRVSSPIRETHSWFQPIIEPSSEGICVLICRKRGIDLELLLGLKFECGIDDFYQFSPTVQSLPRENLDKDENFFIGLLGDKQRGRVIIDVKHSEEGGRFFREINRYVVYEITEDIKFARPENYIWINYYSLIELLGLGNILSVQARTLVSLLHNHYRFTSTGLSN